MKSVTTAVHGAGLGLRRALTGPLAEVQPGAISFLEVAPENWMNIGGKLGRQFRSFTERFPFVTHGLSLSIGSPAPLDVDFVRRVKKFLDQHGIRDYTEHLTYCSDDGHLYDLMPIPFTEAAVKYVSARVRRVQDILGRRIALENASYYVALGAPEVGASRRDAGERSSSRGAPAEAPGASAGGRSSSRGAPAEALGASAGGRSSSRGAPAEAPGREMSELEFIRAVIERADCDLLLDVNNIYVNSINHRYDPVEFLYGLPGERIRYVHVAGHFEEAEDLRVDTHGTDVIDLVWDLLDKAYARFGVLPTLLERDFNIPPLAQLMQEIEHIRQLQAHHQKTGRAANG